MLLVKYKLHESGNLKKYVNRFSGVVHKWADDKCGEMCAATHTHTLLESSFGVLPEY